MTRRVRPWRPHPTGPQPASAQQVRGWWIRDHDEWMKVYNRLAKQRDRYYLHMLCWVIVSLGMTVLFVLACAGVL